MVLITRTPTPKLSSPYPVTIPAVLFKYEAEFCIYTLYLLICFSEINSLFLESKETTPNRMMNFYAITKHNLSAREILKTLDMLTVYGTQTVTLI
jgi:hypothetical protein